MTITTISTALHTAYLDPMTGAGVLVLPHLRDDVDSPDPLGNSLQACDWNAVMRAIDAHAFEPLEGEDGDLPYDGTMDDGRDLISLYGRNPIISNASLEEVNEAYLALQKLAKVAQPGPID